MGRVEAIYAIRHREASHFRDGFDVGADAFFGMSSVFPFPAFADDGMSVLLLEELGSVFPLPAFADDGMNVLLLEELGDRDGRFSIVFWTAFCLDDPLASDTSNGTSPCICGDSKLGNSHIDASELGERS